MPDYAPLVVLNSEQTRQRLPYPALATALEHIMTRTDVIAPLRTAIALERGGQLLVMPACDSETGMTKVVTIHPENPSMGRPTLQGELTVFDTVTGQRYGILDGATVSARRTAALSLLAALHLAPHPNAPVLIVGAGKQARTHLDAFVDGLGTRRVFIASRSPAPARALADHACSRGLTASVVERPEDALHETRIIATTTTSATPVLPNTLPPGTFVAGIGAFRPEMAELPPDLLARATVIVDNLTGAREEAGDLIQAHEQGALDWSTVHELPDLIANRVSIRGDPIIFKSVGTSAWDLAAAKMAFGCGPDIS